MNSKTEKKKSQKKKNFFFQVFFSKISLKILIFDFEKISIIEFKKSE